MHLVRLLVGKFKIEVKNRVRLVHFLNFVNNKELNKGYSKKCERQRTNNIFSSTELL